MCKIGAVEESSNDSSNSKQYHFQVLFSSSVISEFKETITINLFDFYLNKYIRRDNSYMK